MISKPSWALWVRWLAFALFVFGTVRAVQSYALLENEDLLSATLQEARRNLEGREVGPEQVIAVRDRVGNKFADHSNEHLNQIRKASCWMLVAGVLFGITTFQTKVKSPIWARYRLWLGMLGFGLLISGIAVVVFRSYTAYFAAYRFFAQARDQVSCEPIQGSFFSPVQLKKFAHQTEAAGGELISRVCEHCVYFVSLFVAGTAVLGILSFVPNQRPATPSLRL